MVNASSHNNETANEKKKNIENECIILVL